MKNKLIALLLTTTIAAGMILTGCSGENKNNSGTGNTKEVSITNGRRKKDSPLRVRHLTVVPVPRHVL